MESGVSEEVANPWGIALFRTLKRTEPQSASEQAAFFKWLDLNSASEEARRDIQRTNNYVLAVVLFAASLFFAGISTKLRTERGQAVVLGLGCVLFIGTVVWVATFPVSLAI